MNDHLFIHHTILNINHEIPLDPVLVMCMQKIFDWANEQGLAGKKVYALEFKEPLQVTEKEFENGV